MNLFSTPPPLLFLKPLTRLEDILSRTLGQEGRARVQESLLTFIDPFLSETPTTLIPFSTAFDIDDKSLDHEAQTELLFGVL